MTKAEALVYAEKVADYFLFSWSKEFGRKAGNLILTNSQVLILAFRIIGLDVSSNDILHLREFGSALETRDRDRLVSWLMEYAESWPKDEAEMLPAKMSELPGQVRALAAKGLQNIKLTQGAASKIRPHEYSSLAELGDRLVPLVAFILKEQGARTKRSIREMIEYRKNDYPSEGDYLLKHLHRLDSILNDDVLLERAKKLPTRARLVADAMAGAEFNLEPRTSLERAREGRRAPRRKL